jgi:hypothetical protein
MEPHEVTYIIDFSRSVNSPEKRVAWKAAFLKSREDAAEDTVSRVTAEVAAPRMAKISKKGEIAMNNERSRLSRFSRVTPVCLKEKRRVLLESHAARQGGKDQCDVNSSSGFCY